MDVWKSSKTDLEMNLFTPGCTYPGCGFNPNLLQLPRRQKNDVSWNVSMFLQIVIIPSLAPFWVHCEMLSSLWHSLSNSAPLQVARIRALLFTRWCLSSKISNIFQDTWRPSGVLGSTTNYKELITIWTERQIYRNQKEQNRFLFFTVLSVTRDYKQYTDRSVQGVGYFQQWSHLVASRNKLKRHDLTTCST